MRKLWIDDNRPAPEGWDLAKDYWEAIRLLDEVNYDEVSFDHDLASFDENGSEKHGANIMDWLELRHANGGYIPPKMDVHSANPVGRKNIFLALEAIRSRPSGWLIKGP